MRGRRSPLERLRGSPRKRASKHAEVSRLHLTSLPFSLLLFRSIGPSSSEMNLINGRRRRKRRYAAFHPAPLSLSPQCKCPSYFFVCLFTCCTTSAFTSTDKSPAPSSQCFHRFCNEGTDDRDRRGDKCPAWAHWDHSAPSTCVCVRACMCIKRTQEMKTRASSRTHVSYHKIGAPHASMPETGVLSHTHQGCACTRVRVCVCVCIVFGR